MKLFNSLDNQVNLLRKSLSKTRNSFVQKLNSLFQGKSTFTKEDYENLESILLQSDFGLDFSEVLINKVKKQNIGTDIGTGELNYLIKSEFLSYFSNTVINDFSSTSGLHVIQIVGINGSGKTTTIAKLANYFVKRSKKVLIASCDTFRAAANEQLKCWANSTGVEIIEDFSSDAAAVAFETLKIAVEREYDVVLIDTAGRLHTNLNLMNELKKIHKVVVENLKENSKHEVLLVVDGNSGQNAKNQLTEFLKYIPITGLIITKLDGTAKGGSVVQLALEKKIIIRFLGIGEEMEDLFEFDPKLYINSILE